MSLISLAVSSIALSAWVIAPLATASSADVAIAFTVFTLTVISKSVVPDPEVISVTSLAKLWNVSTELLVKPLVTASTAARPISSNIFLFSVTAPASPSGVSLPSTPLIVSLPA